ncbi:MAG: hypothetical protein IH955_08235 [Chloroflexi bacterium]|nr:hypothetical protein [Chloroflexota bacterium]
MAEKIDPLAEWFPIAESPVIYVDPSLAYAPRMQIWDVGVELISRRRSMGVGSSPETNVLEALEQADILTRLTAEVSHLRSEIRDSSANFETMVEELVVVTSALKESIENQASVNTVHLISLHDDRYELKAPLLVILEEYEDEVIARWPEIDLYYSADIASEALAGLESEIIQLYTELSSSSLDELGVLPKRWLKTLSRVVNAIA